MWIAQIIFDKQLRRLGQFDDEIAAAKAYDAAAREMLGTGVTVNFPTEDERRLADSGAPPECPNLPDGMIERRQVLAEFDLPSGTFRHWEKRGWITCGRLVTIPGRPGRTKVYPPDEVRRQIEKLRGEPEFPPPGFIDFEDAPSMFGVTPFRWQRWEQEKRVTCAQWMSVPGRGGRRKVYPIDKLEKQVAASLQADSDAFPPEGHVDWHGAIQMAGVSTSKWLKWQREGRISCGRWFPVAERPGKKKAYPIEQLQRELNAIREGVPFPPEGFVRREEAARMFGVSTRAWSQWEKSGRVTCGRMVPVPDRPGRVKVYPVATLQQLLKEFRNPPPFPPDGFVGREDARRMFGVSLSAWTDWERRGRITCGELVPIPGKPGRCKIYPVKELERLRAEFRRQEEEAAKRLEPYPDPDRPGCWRIPIRSQLHQLEAIIDEQSLPLVRGKHWHWAPGSNGGSGAVMLAGKNGEPKPPLHQVIMGVRGRQHRVGHLNGDPLDCRRENLIVRTPVQQAAARKKSPMKAGKPCSSRFKGVTLADSGRKWSANISWTPPGSRKTVTHALGHFRSELDAALAYDKAARELFGEHAALNVPDARTLERLRAEDTPFEPLYDEFPPPGWMDRYEACAMFGVSVTTWMAWEKKGRITCGTFFPMPDDKPGRCKLYPVDELEKARAVISQLGKPYPDPDRAGCWRVPLSGYLEYREAIVDAESLSIVAGHNWNWSPRHGDVGVPGQVILASLTGPNPTLARLIAGVDGNPDLHVQYRNGDPLDCRRDNLFIKTMQEQTFGNKKFRKVKGQLPTSMYKGVCWDKRRGRWVAQIVKDGEHYALGRFDRETDAAWAYDEKARELFGEDYAWFNFPDGKPRAPEEYAETDERRLEKPDIEQRSSEYVGVAWDKYAKKWVAHFTAQGKLRHLGQFDDDRDAAKAYDKASREAHGAWAYTNFPTEMEVRLRAQWYDRERACEFLGITKSTFKRWIRDGKVPEGRKVPWKRGLWQKVYALEDLKPLKQQFEHRHPTTTRCQDSRDRGLRAAA